MEDPIEEEILITVNKSLWEEFKRYRTLNASKILPSKEVKEAPLEGGASRIKSLASIFKDITEGREEKVNSAEVRKTENAPLNAVAVLPANDLSKAVPLIPNSTAAIGEPNHPKLLGSYKNVPTIEELRRKKKG